MNDSNDVVWTKSVREDGRTVYTAPSPFALCGRRLCWRLRQTNVGGQIAWETAHDPLLIQYSRGAWYVLDIAKASVESVHKRLVKECFAELTTDA